MTAETFPAKEKIATDLGSQIAWLQGEMGYGTGKMHGLPEHLRRMATDPDDALSMYGFMSEYWSRFDLFRKAFADHPTQELANKVLQASGKTVTGAANKVSLILWLQAGQPPIDDLGDLNATALTLIRQRADQLQSQYEADKLLELSHLDYKANPLGHAIIGLFESYISDRQNTENLLGIAIQGSAMGILMWQAHAQILANQGYEVKMPKPGLGSGNIEAW